MVVRLFQSLLRFLRFTHLSISINLRTISSLKELKDEHFQYSGEKFSRINLVKMCKFESLLETDIRHPVKYTESDCGDINQTLNTNSHTERETCIEGFFFVKSSG